MSPAQGDPRAGVRLDQALPRLSALQSAGDLGGDGRMKFGLSGVESAPAAPLRMAAGLSVAAAAGCPGALGSGTKAPGTAASAATRAASPSDPGARRQTANAFGASAFSRCASFYRPDS